MTSLPLSLPVIGPGSQPDEPPSCLQLPQGMATFRAPPTPASSAGSAEARRLLLELVRAMRAARFGDGPPPRLDLEGLAPQVLDQVEQILGQGEVSAVVSTPAGTVRILETAFASLWRVGGDHVIERDHLEVGPVPRAVLAGLVGLRRELAIPPEPPGLMNAPALLRELAAQAARRRPGDAAHVVNLTLLPTTPEDLAYLHGALGTGPVAIHSRGYGSCRVTSTRLAGAWWVQYFNSMGALILDTIEVVEVPAAALAAVEDHQDTIARLEEWLETLEEA